MTKSERPPEVYFWPEMCVLSVPQTVPECDQMLRSFMSRCGGRRVIVSQTVADVYEKAGGDVSLLQIVGKMPTS